MLCNAYIIVEKIKLLKNFYGRFRCSICKQQSNKTIKAPSATERPVRLCVIVPINLRREFLWFWLWVGSLVSVLLRRRGRSNCRSAVCSSFLVEQRGRLGVKQDRWRVDKISMTRTIAKSIARSTTSLKERKVDDRADKGC